MKKRSLSNAFIDKLLSDYKALTDYVVFDDTLDMEFRGEEVMVYYRGGRLLSLSETGVLTPLDQNYGESIPLYLNNIEEYIPKAKHLIDVFQVAIKANLGEKEISQRIVMENNYSPYSNDTDYFIADMEYCQGDGENCQFDLIGLKWPSTPAARKTLNFKIAVIETKQGIHSLRTSTHNPGLKRHYEDYTAFVNGVDFMSIATDMVKIFCQKCELGLVKMNSRSEPITRNSQFKIDEKPEFIAVLANYKRKSNELTSELNSISADSKISFATSNYMGYGLFESSLISLAEITKDVE